MGGKSSSKSSSTQSTTTRDERIAATDNAVVIKDAFQTVGNINVTDGGAIEAFERLSSGIIEGAGKLIDKALVSNDASRDKALEFVSSKEEDSNSSNFQKALPWIAGTAAVIAIAGSIKK